MKMPSVTAAIMYVRSFLLDLIIGNQFLCQYRILRLIHMDPATESGRSESGLFVIDDYFIIMTVFIRRPPVEDNNAPECIRTVAATYGILQPYEYERLRTRWELRMKP